MLLLILFLVILLWFLLQNGKIQQFISEKVTTYLSKELNTQVSIKNVEIDFFDKLLLEDLFIADQEGDTLLYSRQLKADMSISILSLLRNRYDIDNIYLTDAQINLNRKEHEPTNNLQFILDFLTTSQIQKEDNKNSKPVFLDVDGIYLKNLRFYNKDMMRGLELDVFVPEGEILIDEVNLPENFIKIKETNIHLPDVAYDLYPQKLAPVVMTTVTEDGEIKEEFVVRDSTAKELKISMDDLSLNDAHFVFHNYRRYPVKTTPADILDIGHLDVLDIQIKVEDFFFTEDVFNMELKKLSLREGSGFVLNNLTAKEAIFSNRKTTLNDMQLVTPYSTVGDTLVFKYKEYNDYNDFPNKVIMDGRFNKSKVAVKDIMVFAPKLSENAFFVKNQEEILEIDGRLLGKIKNLRGRDLNLKLGSSTYFKGNFNSRNLNTKNEEALNLEVDRLITDIKTLRLLVPRFNPPSNFDKLGQLNFSGRFDGFFVDFVAYGELVSDLGTAEMDMRMDLRNGRTGAKYSGGLSLQEFDLGAWSGNSDLGMVTFKSEVKEGKGLTLESVDAKLGAVIDNFSFKGYTYRNVTIDGQLNKKFFDGDLIVKDDNIDFTFSGNISNIDSIPEFDFKANINHLDLLALNISKEDLVISGEVDLNLKDRTLATIQGYADANNFKIVRNGAQEFILDSIRIASLIKPNEERIFEVKSDVLNAKLEGRFNVEEVPQALTQYLYRNYPKAYEQFGLKPKETPPGESTFDFHVFVSDTKNATLLINPELDTLRNITLKGFFDSKSDSLNIDLDVPEVKFADMAFREIALQMEGMGGENKMNLEIYHSQIANQDFEPLTLSGDLFRDTFDFELVAINWTTILDNLNLTGEFSLVEDFFQIQFFPSNLVILKTEWDIDEDNYLRFGKGFVDTKNFTLTSDEKKISLNSLGKKGLSAIVENFDFSLIDELWIYDKMDFRGLFNVQASALDLYNLKDLSLSVEADTFEVNGDDWGAFRLDAAGADLKTKTRAYLSITNGPQQLTGEGFYFPPTSTIFKQKKKKQFDFDFTIRKYPLHIIEYFVVNGLSNTIGEFGANVKIDGTFKKPNFGGDITIDYGALTIDYLNTRYFVNNQKARITNFIFDVTGGQITDKLGNVATLYGGITHERMRFLGSDVILRSDAFLCLDTQKEDNDIFYGYGLIKGDVHFTGRFNKTNIKIDGETLPESYLVIPVSYTEEAEEVSFIKFIDKNKVEEPRSETRGELLGIEMDLRLAITEEAEVQLIFDEKAGDIMEGSGKGNIDLHMDRSGEISMHGHYDITKGKYLFTYNNIFNKPFTVREGGTILWEKDPYNAILNIDAEYKGLTTSVYNFVSEYIDDSNLDGLKTEAQQPTSVDLVMNLTGQLLEPIINFEIQFPELTGALQNYANTKLQAIEQDPNELNRQVFGLFVVGGFLPASSAFQGRTNDIVVNTFTEVLTSQLSLLTTQLLSEFVTDVNFISGIGVDIDYNVYEADITQNLSGTKFGIRPEIGILDDRLTFRGGGDVNFGQAYGSDAFLAGDIEVEYVITRDRRLKFRAYQLYDNTIAGERDKRGIGIRYRREGDSLKELFRRKSKEEKEVLKREKEAAKAKRREEKIKKKLQSKK